MTKKWEREEARRLRAEEGLSVREICERLGVSKSSVSVWVRDIKLTPEQKQALKDRYGPGYPGRRKGADANKKKGLEQRKQYQEEGRIKAREGDPLHLAGCMLYWAEGRKDRNTLEFTNSDAAMMQFYIRFLRESMNVADEDIKLQVNCYLENGLTLEQIEQYWLDLLGLQPDCLRKPNLHNRPKSSKQQGRILLYGTLKLYIGSTQLVQHVFGAIQEYSGIDNPDWLL